MDQETRWQKDLRYYRMVRHLRITHGEHIAKGIKNRRKVAEERHDELHELGCGHSKEWGLI